ncbi:hypothetical protein [Mesorhizobium sp. 1M-11]|uniref:hypothetical protein n=1 Tax=Mesorhizobium sp. 1M-11 TaxID=1529006 RepID=UPI0006C76A57|nr:hypothetical protein [Mesorhizobium sp. 1M-11]
MSFGYISLDRPGTALRGYSHSGAGAKTLVTIKIEVTDPHELGWLLEELAAAQKEAATRRAAEAARAKAEKKAAKAKPREIGHQVLLGLPYYGGEK